MSSMIRVYLNVKLQVALVHLPGHDTFYNLHRNQLEAVVRRAEDVMSLSLLDLHIQKAGREDTLLNKYVFSVGWTQHSYHKVSTWHTFRIASLLAFQLNWN